MVMVVLEPPPLAEPADRVGVKGSNGAGCEPFFVELSCRRGVSVCFKELLDSGECLGMGLPLPPCVQRKRDAASSCSTAAEANTDGD